MDKNNKEENPENSSNNNKETQSNTNEIVIDKPITSEDIGGFQNIGDEDLGMKEKQPSEQPNREEIQKTENNKENNRENNSKIEKK